MDGVRALPKLPGLRSSPSVKSFILLESIASNPSQEIDNRYSEELRQRRKKTKTCSTQTDETPKTDDLKFIRRGGYIFLLLTVSLMVAAIMFTATSDYVANAQPCELKTAIDAIQLDYSPHPCKYNSIKEMAKDLTILGSVNMGWNLIAFLVIVWLCIFGTKFPKTFILTIYFTLGICALIFLGVCFTKHNQLANHIKKQTDINYVKLQKSMVSWLVEKYTSDNINSISEVSNAWNSFFIQYDCCAVREVQGTTNDFDQTPWCTSSGSCQATSSQIPKTCCKSVTQDDYQNAPAYCHASVNPGTFKPGCISRIRELSNTNIDEFQVFMLLSSIFALAILQSLEILLASTFVIQECYYCHKTKKPNKVDITWSSSENR